MALNPRKQLVFLLLALSTQVTLTQLSAHSSLLNAGSFISLNTGSFILTYNSILTHPYEAIS
jgi:hypothetical protein